MEGMEGTFPGNSPSWNIIFPFHRVNTFIYRWQQLFYLSERRTKRNDQIILVFPSLLYAQTIMESFFLTKLITCFSSDSDRFLSDQTLETSALRLVCRSHSLLCNVTSTNDAMLQSSKLEFPVSLIKLTLKLLLGGCDSRKRFFFLEVIAD